MALGYSGQHNISYPVVINITTLLLLICIPFSSLALEFDFPELNLDNPRLKHEGNGNSNITSNLGSGIELTQFNRTDQIGQLKYYEDLQLWDSGSGRAADFTTTFSFIIYSPTEGAHGDGVAFFLADPPFGVPNNTDGSFLGLANYHESWNSTEQRFVAVEFDTFPNQREVYPQNATPHVGIDVKSLNSSNATSWSCDLASRKVYNATISYSSVMNYLSVFFTGYKGDVPFVQNLSYQINLTEHLSQNVTFGFSATNGLYTSSQSLLSWSFNSTDFTTSTHPEFTSNTSTNSKTGLIIGLSIGGACLFVGALALIYFGLWKWKKKKAKEDDDEDDDELGFATLMDCDFERSSGAKRFSYKELVAATNNFSEEGKLGQGGFGWVYRGFLKNMNMSVAIKKISTRSQQGIKEYASEVKIISRIRHRNLVQLIGWCHRKKDLLLVYEFMANGSLDFHLFRRKSMLNWATRYNIARGLASALLYLHEEWEQCVLHRDIKSSNVMLDSNFNAKLGDFGLARLVDHEKGSQTTMVAGTLGYLAPECFTTLRASRESDVYSFGVVMLEIACGRKPIDPLVGNDGDHQNGLVEWVWKLYGMNTVLEAADPRLCGEFDEQQMERLMIVGLWCAHPDHKLRPSIKKAIHVLEFEAPLPALPLEMPLPNYSTIPRSNHGTTSASSSENTQTESSTDNYSQYTGSSLFTSSFSR